MAGPIPNAPPAEPFSRLWVTLVTRSSYLPGLALLIHSLYQHGSVHPFVVQYTEALAQDCIDCLGSLAEVYPLLRLQQVEPLPLPSASKSVAERFADTLTKLRAFEIIDDPSLLAELSLPRAPEQICFLDADIMVFRNMDDIFDIPRPDGNWISAHHACKCTHDPTPWAQPDWTTENCALTPLRHPSALMGPVPSSAAEGARPTHTAMNSGVFVFTPSRDLRDRINHFRLNDPRVETFHFPDQNFLDEFFRDRWVPIGWQYNALKTHYYWHTNCWRDEEVRALHYIVDKPWEKRIGPDGIAGYKNRDGVTHSWWWREYESWLRFMKAQGKGDIADQVARYVAPPLAA